jgi:predicted MFS family arabinose efflux permease
MGASAGAAAIAAMLALLLPEVRHAVPAPARSLVQFVRATAQALHQATGVWHLLGLMATLMFLMDMMWLTYQPNLTNAGIGIGALGVVFAALSAVSALGSRLARGAMTRLPAGTIMIALFLALAGTAAGLLFVHDWRVLVVMIPAQLAAGVYLPVGNTYVAVRTPAALRATALSAMGLTWQLGTMASLVVGAAILDAQNMRIVFEVGLVLALVGVAVARVASLGQRTGSPAGLG